MRALSPCLGALPVAGLLTWSPPAGARFGGVWFDTAARTAFAIEGKYPCVATARCFPLPLGDRDRYHARSFVKGAVRLWDHFLCGLYIRNRGVCLAVAHHIGREWYQLVLTSSRFRGCTPYDLR